MWRIKIFIKPQLLLTYFYAVVRMLALVCIRWHGSIYKFIWKDFACYAALHYFIALIFYAAMDDNWKRYE